MFQSYLRMHKLQKFSVKQMMLSMLELFKLPAELHLARGFRSFIPVANRACYDELLEAQLQGPRPVVESTGATALKRQRLAGAVDAPSTAAATVIPLQNDPESSTEVVMSDMIVTDMIVSGVGVVPEAAAVMSNDVMTDDVVGPNPEVSYIVAFECPICTRDTKQPFAARCGHVCCYDCWSKWLPERWHCPVCRNRVRLGQLTHLQLS